MHKFFPGDLVRIADDLGKSMSHFPKGQDAIVLYSYSMKYTPSAKSDKDFGLYLLKDGRESSWYHEHQLTLLEEDRFDLLPISNVHRRLFDEKVARRNNTEKNNG